MFFYFLIFSSFIMACGMLYHVNKLRKHDRILFSFCQIRRDAMQLIASRQLSLSKAEYNSVRDLSLCLNVVIHDYDECKNTIFNIRRLIRMMKAFKQTTKDVDRIKIPNDPEIIQLHSKFRIAMFEAFLTYTPLIRSEILVKLLVMILAFIGNRGVKSMGKAGEYFNWLLDEMKNFQNTHPRHHAHA